MMERPRVPRQPPRVFLCQALGQLTDQAFAMTGQVSQVPLGIETPDQQADAVNRKFRHDGSDAPG